MRAPVILLMGPTASGKTAIAVALAQRLPVDVISVDSALVYRDMNIGTAKPDAATLALAPHALIDIISPEQSYSAAQFVHDATQLITDSHAAGRIPLLVGGTMLYFKALQQGLADLPQADPDLRLQLQQRAADQGWPALHAELAAVDPDSAARLHPSDAQRIERALEVYYLAGETLTALLARQQASVASYDYVKLALQPSERNQLHARIALRFQQMLDGGLLDEVRALRQRYQLHAELPSMRCVGYRQAWDYLDGAYDLTELRDRGIFATRQLAKRQLTWLRSMDELISFDCLAPDLEQQLVRTLTSIDLL